MEATAVLDALFRWIHIVAGIIWIGLLYFFNFVNGPFAATMDGPTKQKVVQKVYDSLAANGAFVAIENIIDNERRQNTLGLLMSLNMLIENGDAFDYTADDFERWAQASGFKRTELIPLAGPTSAMVAFK